MLQEIPTPTLRESRTVVLETERLVLRQPTLADVKAIAAVVADKRVSINLRRVPHPYTLDDATTFVTTVASTIDTVFLIERERTVIGLVGVSWEDENAPELGYCLGVDHWGKGYATEAARAVIDYAFEEFSIEQPHLGCARPESGIAPRAGEMRLPVDRRRTASFPGARLIHAGRLLQIGPCRVGVDQKLAQLDAAPHLKATR